MIRVTHTNSGRFVDAPTVSTGILRRDRGDGKIVEVDVVIIKVQPGSQVDSVGLTDNAGDGEIVLRRQSVTIELAP